MASTMVHNAPVDPDILALSYRETQKRCKELNINAQGCASLQRGPGLNEQLQRYPPPEQRCLSCTFANVGTGYITDDAGNTPNCKIGSRLNGTVAGPDR